MPERIDGGRVLAAVGAVALIVSLFLHWFSPALTGWDVFEFLDLLLTFLALVVIVHAVPALARAVHAPEEPSAVFPTIGIVAFVIVAVALINHPPAASGRSLAFGAWLAFAGATLMAIGGVLSAARISIVVAVSPRPRAAPPPEARPTQRFDAGAEAETQALRRSRRE